MTADNRRAEVGKMIAVNAALKVAAARRAGDPVEAIGISVPGISGGIRYGMGTEYPRMG
ncbi:MAG: hypothetical protein R2758_09590 [Bacteroidales bacterium]